MLQLLVRRLLSLCGFVLSHVISSTDGQFGVLLQLSIHSWEERPRLHHLGLHLHDAFMEDSLFPKCCTMRVLVHEKQVWERVFCHRGLGQFWETLGPEIGANLQGPLSAAVLQELGMKNS
ncbi:hypothetical protein ACP4OV_028803 [Aristida adscensionis]